LSQTDAEGAQAAPDSGRHTRLACLVAIAGHHGLDLSFEGLIHRYALGAAETTDAQLLAVARDHGLKARAARLPVDGLGRVGAVFPLLTVLKNGNAVVVVGRRVEESGPKVAVYDPLNADRRLLILDETAFAERWDGQVFYLKRTYSLTDAEQPFGLRWFAPEILRQGKLFRDVVIAAFTLHVLGLVTPMYVQVVIDKVLTHQAYGTLYVLAAGVSVAIVFEAVFGFLRRYVLLYASNRIDIRVAVRTFAHLLSLPAPFFDRSSAGVLVQHMQQGEKVRQFLTGRLFLTAIDATALLVFVPMLLLYSPTLALVVIGFTVAIAGVVLALIGPFRRRLKELYEAQGERQALLVETIHGIQTVKALAVEPRRRRAWDRCAARMIHSSFRVGAVSAGAQTVTDALDKLQMVAVVALGAHLVFDGQLSVGALIAFQMIAARVSGPLVQMVGLIHEYQEVAVAVSMLARVMNEKPESAARQRRLRVNIEGEVSFDRVTFRYGDAARPALDQVSFTIPPGRVVGVVGRSGSGKTTVTRLIQGVYTPQFGHVRIDGHDIRELDLPYLRANIGVVLQENFVFRATVRDNIAMTRPDARFEEIVEAARLGGAHEFIRLLPQGYDTLLEENGANLSGGQRQRLAIARALLARPRILILDEATSALDPDTEAVVQQNLNSIARGRTVFIVSHRLSLLVEADLILVLEQGGLIGAGRHGELLQNCPQYAHLWAQQNRSAA
jgi:ATP-binding cassette, subfamily B, bacterial HlyB/CyaB